jgi:putative YhbY family RNA-binding protein
MLSLSPAERRQLRAKAHRLHPVVSIGQQGLTAGVLHEIDVNLLAHELIKVRVFSADRTAREAVLERICAELEAAPVQHIGKLLVVWRPAPASKVEPAGQHKAPGRRAQQSLRPKRRRATARQATPLGAAKSVPQVRRPREPVARVPARPPAGRTGRVRDPRPASDRRRRQRGP